MRGSMQMQGGFDNEIQPRLNALLSLAADPITTVLMEDWIQWSEKVRGQLETDLLLLRVRCNRRIAHGTDFDARRKNAMHRW